MSSPTSEPAAVRPNASRGLSRSHLPGRRASAAPLPKIGMAVFAVGVLAILVDVILFASGSRDLPLWLNLICVLAPIGLGIGLVGVFLENRNGSPALAARRAARAADPDA